MLIPTSEAHHLHQFVGEKQCTNDATARVWTNLGPPFLCTRDDETANERIQTALKERLNRITKKIFFLQCNEHWKSHGTEIDFGKRMKEDLSIDSYNSFMLSLDWYLAFSNNLFIIRNIIKI